LQPVQFSAVCVRGLTPTLQEVSREHRRVLHITAEQRRRGSIKVRQRHRLHACTCRHTPSSIVGSGPVSSLKEQAAEWAHMPSPSSQGLALRQDTARTELVSAEHYPCMRMLLIFSSVKACVLCMRMATFS